MNGFDYIRRISEFYEPRTPKAALVAVIAGFIPVEAFIYRAAAITPLFEEPYNVDELERVLARPDLGFGEAMALSEIFSEITRSPDKELALFAAESLGSLEDRYLKLVNEYEKKVAAILEANPAISGVVPGSLVEGEGVPGAVENASSAGAPSELPMGKERDEAESASELLVEMDRFEETVPQFSCEDIEEGEAIFAWARSLYEYALISGRSKLIRNYYLKEAYYTLHKSPASCRSAEGFDLLIRCLLRLGLVDQADKVIHSELGKRSDDILLSLAAESAFLRRDPRGIRAILTGRKLDELRLEPRLNAALAAWMA